MKKIGLGILIIITALAISGITTVATANSTPSHQGKPDLRKPVPSTDVELVKKTTLRGKPAGKGKPLPEGPSATGTLGQPITGDKYAIVIGIADYPGIGNDLKYTDEDAEEMINALTTVYGGFDGANIRDFIDKEGQGSVNATRENIISAIQKIGSMARPEDEVVFFFSGHGGKGRALDGDKEAIDESIVVHDGNALVYLWDGELKQFFDEFQTSRIVFVFDSCVAGGMTDLAAPGRIINMATTETGTAYESDAWGNGQFTYYFVDEGMIGGLADTHDYAEIEGNESTTIEEAFDYAKAKSVNQIPTIKDLFTNDLLL